MTTKGPFAGDPIFRPAVQKPEVLSLIRLTLNKELFHKNEQLRDWVNYIFV